MSCGDPFPSVWADPQQGFWVCVWVSGEYGYSRERLHLSSVIPQGCPEVGEEELVSVPEAKFTKGEFQVGMPLPLPTPSLVRILGSCWQLGGVRLSVLFPGGWTVAQNNLTLKPLPHG